MMRVKYRVFRLPTTTWETLFEQAAEFASSLAPERLINISHSSQYEGAITVWYWDDDRDENDVV